MGPEEFSGSLRIFEWLKNFSAVLGNFTGILTTLWVVRDILGMLKIFLNGEGVCSKQENFWADKKCLFGVVKMFSSNKGL